jgi:hypothetical protein
MKIELQSETYTLGFMTKTFNTSSGSAKVNLSLEPACKLALLRKKKQLIKKQQLKIEQ